jgi:DNA-binding SARP family transcriptional activator
MLCDFGPEFRGYAVAYKLSMVQLPLPADELHHAVELVSQDDFVGLLNLLAQFGTGLKTDDHTIMLLLMIATALCQASLQTNQEIDWYRRAEQQAVSQIVEYKKLLRQIFELLIEPTRSPGTTALPLHTIPDTGHLPHHISPQKNKLNLGVIIRSFFNGQPPFASAAASLALELPTNDTDLSRAVLQTQAAEQAVTPLLVLYCLGAFKSYRDHRLIDGWQGIKAQSVFKYLLLHRSGPVQKDKLIEVFWRDSDPQAARRSLHQAIYIIRRALKRDEQAFQSIVFENECYSLDPELNIWIDYEEFNRRAALGLELEKRGYLAQALVEYSVAEGLFQGELLEEDLYEEWVEPHRLQLRDVFLELADRLSEHYLKQTEYTAAMALCRKIIRFDRYRESAYLRLMKCYIAQGQRHLAIRQYLTCLEILKEDLNLLPSEETQILYTQLIGV